METIITIALWYVGIAVVMLLINAFIAGYNEADITINDITDSFLWPISIMTFFGILSRIVLQKYKGK